MISVYVLDIVTKNSTILPVLGKNFKDYSYNAGYSTIKCKYFTENDCSRIHVDTNHYRNLWEWINLNVSLFHWDATKNIRDSYFKGKR